MPPAAWQTHFLLGQSEEDEKCPTWAFRKRLEIGARSTRIAFVSVQGTAFERRRVFVLDAIFAPQANPERSGMCDAFSLATSKEVAVKVSRKMQRQVEIQIRHAIVNEVTRSGRILVLEEKEEKLPTPTISKWSAGQSPA